jgi:[acyl-carrier-protein] S-malonyltransferase|tara:strand:+ start:228 stop:1166 length:939 start_codon:yes stop_codon:yes gene_type:complete
MSSSAFLAFPGQGSQHLSMLSKGGILDIALSSKYSQALECCSELISHDVLKLIEEGPEDLINQTSITQPLLVLCSYLHYNKLVNSIDISPTYMAGHSLGEYSALVAANSISITEALQLVRKRGELMELAPTGSMSAIMGLEQDIISEICLIASHGNNSHVQCANLNSPNQTVISGHDDAVERAQDLCISEGAKRSIKLKVSIASHSKLMVEAADEFKNTLNTVEFKMPDTKIIHNVSVDSVSLPEDIPSLLISQLHSPVRWVETCHFISTLNLPIIECGPGKVLSGLFKANKLDNYFSSSDEDFYEKINNYG